MNPIFLEALRSNGGPGATIRTASGTIPAHVKPPAEPAQTATGSVLNLASAESSPLFAPRSSAQVASAGGSGSDNMLRSQSEDHAPAARNAVGVFAPKSKPATSNPTPPVAAMPVVIHSVSERQPVNMKPANALVPTPADALPKRQASGEPRSTPESGLLSGAAPTVPAGRLRQPP